MGIFGINYNKPGPGVNRYEPQKKGIKRLFELLRRDLNDLIKINITFIIAILPSVVLFVYNYLKVGNVLLLILSIILTFPIGGAVTASFYCISMLLLNESRHVIYEFWRKFKENILQAAPFGMLYVSFLYLQIYVWTSMFQQIIDPTFATMILMAIALLFVSMVAPYVFLQIGHLELKSRHIYKNSVLIAIRYFSKSIGGLLVSNLHWLLTAMFYPLSLWWVALQILMGFTFSFLINLMFIWKHVDDLFSIGKTIKERREEKTKDIPSVFSSVSRQDIT